MAEPNDNLQSWKDFYDNGLYREEFKKVEILDKTCCGALKEEADVILGNLCRLTEQRPDCSRDGGNYKTIFDTYKEKVDALNGRRKKLIEKLKTVAKAEKILRRLERIC